MPDTSKDHSTTKQTAKKGKTAQQSAASSFEKAAYCSPDDATDLATWHCRATVAMAADPAAAGRGLAGVWPGVWPGSGRGRTVPAVRPARRWRRLSAPGCVPPTPRRRADSHARICAHSFRPANQVQVQTTSVRWQ